MNELPYIDYEGKKLYQIGCESCKKGGPWAVFTDEETYVAVCECGHHAEIIPDSLTRNVVTFKSIPEYFEKEKDGRKANTVRRISEDSKRLKLLRDGAKIIEIVNTETGDNFTREITDFSEFLGVAVISWRHE